MYPTCVSSKLCEFIQYLMNIGNIHFFRLEMVSWCVVDHPVCHEEILMLGSSSPASSSSGEFSRTRVSDVGVLEYGAQRVHRLDLWTFLLDDNHWTEE